MRLSVITIAFNNLNGLRKTLSVFEQERFRDDIELVIVDGNSKDGSKGFLQTQTLTENWISEPDKGIYNAMNKGLSRANGDYVWFLNSGDYVENPITIREVLKILETEPDAVYGETMMVDVHGKHLGSRSEISTRSLPENLNWKSLRYGMNVGHQSFIIKRKLAVNYDETYRYVADIDWMIRSLKNCRDIRNMKTVLSCFTMDGFSSKQRVNSNKERFKVLSRHYGFISNLLAHAAIAVRKLFSFGKV